MVAFRPQLVDFNGDGRLDLVAGSNCCDCEGFFLFRRKEDDSWAPRQRLELLRPGESKVFGIRQESFVTAADWNGDGVPDLLCVGPFRQSISVALGPINESEPILVPHAIDITPRPALTAGSYIQSFAVADWDRDEKPDLLVSLAPSEGPRGIYWYRNLGGPGLTQLAEGKLLLEITPEMSVRGFWLWDQNADGWLDLLLARSDEAITDEAGEHAGWRWTIWLYVREE